MNFNELPLEEKLKYIASDLSNCHIIGSDSLKFGTALEALYSVINSINSKENSVDENNIQ